MRVVALDSISNVRDLGGISVGGGRATKSGLLYRGSALHNIAESDIRRLSDELGLRKIIDLRIGYEVQAKPDALIPGAERLYIPFYDNEVVGYEYFKPVPGTITLGSDFACDPDDFYRDMSNELTAAQIGRALHAVFDSAAAGEPVYFHCSGGKDRAGILALMILQILGAGEEAILEDYLLTNESRQAGIEKIYQRFLRLCEGDEEKARRITDEHCARPGNLTAFRESVDDRYGSMASLIHDVLGFSDADIAELRARCTE